MNIVEKLRKKRRKLQKKIDQIQEECTHPDSATDREARSNGGDPLQKTEYWWMCHCHLCDKRWTEPQ